MTKPFFNEVLNKEMSRKDFLSIMALVVVSLFGVTGVISEMLSHAATPYTSEEAEAGTLHGNATVISDSSASSGKAIIFDVTFVGASTPAANPFGVSGIQETAASISAFETVVGRHIDFLMNYDDWDGGSIPTVSSSTQSALGTRDYMWTLQPTGLNWATLISGGYDSYITAFGQWIQNTWGRNFYVRFAHEMNGTGWYNWQVGGSCGVSSAVDYVDGFNHFASVLKAETTFAKLVWCVNCGPTANIASFYPSACDVMAMDGYNNVGDPSEWATDSQVFAASYAELVTCDAVKPIWVGEVACEEPSSSWTYDGTTYPAMPQYSKGTWVTDFYKSTAYPRLTATTWFNYQKEQDWIVNSSMDSQAAFQTVFAPYSSGVPLV